MPFQYNQIYLFTKESIEALTPGQIGVYGIYRSDAWVYIGKGDIRGELLRYFNGENPCIIKEKPTCFVFEVISGDPSNREIELIKECTPICNRRVG